MSLYFCLLAATTAAAAAQTPPPTNPPDQDEAEAADTQDQGAAFTDREAELSKQLEAVEDRLGRMELQLPDEDLEASEASRRGLPRRTFSTQRSP